MKNPNVFLYTTIPGTIVLYIDIDRYRYINELLGVFTFSTTDVTSPVMEKLRETLSSYCNRRAIHS